jgi:DNA-binding MarR family transcriptional regulator
MANDIQDPPVCAPVADPAALLQALGNPLRWDVLRRLANDGPQSVTDLGAKTGCRQTSMSRHLALLWKVGAVVAVTPPDGDTRKQFYAIPPGRLRAVADGKAIDYGACVLRFA